MCAVASMWLEVVSVWHGLLRALHRCVSFLLGWKVSEGCAWFDLGGVRFYFISFDVLKVCFRTCHIRFRVANRGLKVFKAAP